MQSKKKKGEKSYIFPLHVHQQNIYANNCTLINRLIQRQQTLNMRVRVVMGSSDHFTDSDL